MTSVHSTSFSSFLTPSGSASAARNRVALGSGALWSRYAQTSQPFPSYNNVRDKDKVIVNDDGSVDLYFGPKAPAGKDANWLQTVPEKGWFSILRLYSPTEAWFDKTWRPGEIEQID